MLRDPLIWSSLLEENSTLPRRSRDNPVDIPEQYEHVHITSPKFSDSLVSEPNRQYPPKADFYLIVFET